MKESDVKRIWDKFIGYRPPSTTRCSFDNFKDSIREVIGIEPDSPAKPEKPPILAM